MISKFLNRTQDNFSHIFQSQISAERNIATFVVVLVKQTCSQQQIHKIWAHQPETTPHINLPHAKTNPRTHIFLVYIYYIHTASPPASDANKSPMHPFSVLVFISLLFQYVRFQSARHDSNLQRPGTPRRGLFSGVRGVRGPFRTFSECKFQRRAHAEVCVSFYIGGFCCGMRFV